jgi:hypothetical protein
MPEIVPVMTAALGNARQAVKDAAAAAMTGCMNTVNNKDLEQFIPMLIDTMQVRTHVLRVCVCGVSGARGWGVTRAGLQHDALSPCLPRARRRRRPSLLRACSALAARPPRARAAPQNPTKVPDCVHKLAATTFVQAVEAPTLSIMVPLLVRGLRHDNTTAIKRKVRGAARAACASACELDDAGGSGCRTCPPPSSANTHAHTRSLTRVLHNTGTRARAHSTHARLPSSLRTWPSWWTTRWTRRPSCRSCCPAWTRWPTRWPTPSAAQSRRAPSRCALCACVCLWPGALCGALLWWAGAAHGAAVRGTRRRHTPPRRPSTPAHPPRV